MNGVLKTLLENEYFVGCAMAIIIVGLTQLIKLPYKAATNHIKNEVLRKCVNAVILLIPFAFGLLGEFLYAHYVSQTSFTGWLGSLSGLGGLGTHGIFSFVKEIIKSKSKEKDNPYNTEEGKAVVDLVENVVEDGKIDAKYTSAVDEFRKTISKYRDNK